MSALYRQRTLQWTVEWVHPDGNKTLDKLWETKLLSTAYDDHVRYLDTSQPKKKRKPSQRHKDLPRSTPTPSSDLSAIDPAREAPRKDLPVTNPAGKRKRGADEPNMDEPAEEGPDTAAAADARTSQSSASIPPPSTDPPATKQEPSSQFNFYLHHPSLPSRHPVLIPLPPDARLATSLANRLVLEFPTIFVLRSRPDGTFPEGFVSEEGFFASAKKDLIEEVAGDGAQIDGLNGAGDEGKAGLEDGEVDEGRLLEVLGKDLNGVAGSL